MTPRRVLFVISVFCVSLFTTAIETTAKNRPPIQPGLETANNRKNLTNKERLRSTSKHLKVTTLTVTLSNRDIQKVIKSAMKTCSCACPATNVDSWASCFENCLQRYGVSPASAAACAAACTANPVGCAICAGIHQWIVMGCAQYCVWRNVVGTEQSEIANNQSRVSRKRPVRPLGERS